MAESWEKTYFLMPSLQYVCHVWSLSYLWTSIYLRKYISLLFKPVWIEEFSFSKFFNYLFIFIVVWVPLSPFYPHHALCSTLPASHPWTYPPLVLSMCPLCMFLDGPSPILSHYPSPRQPSGSCQCVLYFSVSGSILLACLFCWLGSTYRWDHMVFVFHSLAYFT